MRLKRQPRKHKQGPLIEAAMECLTEGSHKPVIVCCDPLSLSVIDNSTLMIRIECNAWRCLFCLVARLGSSKAPCKLFRRPLSRPPQARLSRPLVLSAAVAASASQALMSALWTGQMSSVETRQMSAVEPGQMSVVESRQMYSAETRQMSTGKAGRCLFSRF